MEFVRSQLCAVQVFSGQFHQGSEEYNDIKILINDKCSENHLHKVHFKNNLSIPASIFFQNHLPSSCPIFGNRVHLMPLAVPPHPCITHTDHEWPGATGGGHSSGQTNPHPSWKICHTWLMLCFMIRWNSLLAQTINIFTLLIQGYWLVSNICYQITASWVHLSVKPGSYLHLDRALHIFHCILFYSPRWTKSSHTCAWGWQWCWLVLISWAVKIS